jgi:hypothetical protein
MVEVEEYDDIVVPYEAKQREKPEIDLELPVSGEGGAIPDWQKKE